MKKIYKYELEVKDRQVIEMPLLAEILKADEQHGKLCLWALVDVEAVQEYRTIWIIGTGNDTPEQIDEMEYIDTVQMSGGRLVWHLFEEL